MIIKQLSVFLENKPGSLSHSIDALAKGGVNMSALSLADTTEFGVLRLIVDRPEEGKKVLQEDGLFVRLTDVVAVAMDDAPGGAAGMLRMLAEAGQNIEYMYAFVGKETGKAISVICTENILETEKLLTDGGFGTVKPSDVYRI